MRRPRSVRSLVFLVDSLPPALGWVLAEFRLLVNRSIRIALRDDVRSRFRLTKIAYRTLSAEHAIYNQYIPGAFEVAMAGLNVYRSQMRHGKGTNVPYMRRLMPKAENQSFRLDRETGRVRIPIRGTEGVQLDLPLSDWHRSTLSDPAWRPGSLAVTPNQVIVTVRKDAPPPYEPVAAIALDTNESSLDGVAVEDRSARLVTIPFPEVRTVQATHVRRRRRLARRKAHDRRVMRRLLPAKDDGNIIESPSGSTS